MFWLLYCVVACPNDCLGAWCEEATSSSLSTSSKNSSLLVAGELSWILFGVDVEPRMKSLKPSASLQLKSRTSNLLVFSVSLLSSKSWLNVLHVLLQSSSSKSLVFNVNFFLLSWAPNALVSDMSYIAFVKICVNHHQTLTLVIC